MLVYSVVKWFQGKPLKSGRYLVTVFDNDLKKTAVCAIDYYVVGGWSVPDSIDVLAWCHLDSIEPFSIENNIVDYADKYSHDVWEKEMKRFDEICDYCIGCNDVSDYVLNGILDGFKHFEKQKNNE